jgi:hypothetical protein
MDHLQDIIINSKHWCQWFPSCLNVVKTKYERKYPSYTISNNNCQSEFLHTKCNAKLNIEEVDIFFLCKNLAPQ